MDHLTQALLYRTAGLYQIDLTTRKYQAVKPFPPLSSILPDEGEYTNLCELLIYSARGSKGPVNPDFQSFIEKGSDVLDHYARYVTVPTDNGELSLFLIFFMDEERKTGYLLLVKSTPLRDIELRTDPKRQAYDAGYLYSMIVDLDDNECHDIHVSELEMVSQTPASIQYSEWRYMLLPSFSEDDRSFFLTQTDINYLRSQLATSDRRFSFDIKMKNLAGKEIWTRHTAHKMANYHSNHFQLLYTVENIDQEKKQLNLQLRAMEEQSSYGGLTHAFNRKKTEALLKESIMNTTFASPCSVISLTLRNMADIHATFFHQVADNILLQFSTFLLSEFPEETKLGHYLMSTFLCLCPNTELDKAEEMAKRIQEKHAELQYPPIGRLHLAIGVAEIKPQEALSDLLLRIDKTATKAMESQDDALVTERELNASLFEKNSDRILNQIENEVHQHYASKLTLKNLADKYYINSAYLGQLFIQRHDMTFSEYLWKIRMSHAAFLLANTDKYIYEIIEDVGCSNINYFNQQFAETYGLSPAKYRKQKKIQF